MPILTLFVLILSLAFGHLSSASDWTRFRGPNGTGISIDPGLPDELDRKKTLVWSASIPEGNSSPIVVNGRVYFTAHAGDQRTVFCYNAATGQEVWRKSLTKTHQETFHPQNGPTTPTPATDGHNVFVLFPDIGLIAYSSQGKELWKIPLDPVSSVQGLAASPLYIDGKVILFVDTPEEAFVAAFDATSGKKLWKMTRPTGVLGSYATPTAYSRKNFPSELVVAGAVELTGYNAKTGERLWWARVTEFPTAPPFVDGDSVYTVEPAGVSWPPFREIQDLFDRNKDGNVDLIEAKNDQAWALSLNGIDKNMGNGDDVVTPEEYGKVLGAAKTGGMSRIRLGGKGDITISHVVWRNSKGMPDITGALLYQNILYTIRSGILATYDPETGKLLRQERLKNAPGDYYASPVAGDGKIYLINQKGQITVVKAGANWQILSTSQLDDEVIATPAIANGRIYVRTGHSLYCFGSSKP